MLHQVTIICDDIREEMGNKLSLMGLYDESILVDSIPARLAKLCMFQRWTELDPPPERVKIELRGDAIGKTFVATAEASPEKFDKSKSRAQLLIRFAPVDLTSEGTLEFRTFLANSDSPTHTHTVEVRTQKPAAGPH